MSIHYVYMSYVPGAAGNFLSRALNLIDGCYCWVEQGKGKFFYENPNDKLELFSFEPMADRINKTNPENWQQFEDRLQKYYQLDGANVLPPGSISIMPGLYTVDPHNSINADDQETFLAITTQDPKVYEWLILNAMFKNCHLGVAWMEVNAKWGQRSDVYKISLEDFFTWEKFETCYKSICKYLNVAEERINLKHVKTLHSQWLLTILPMEQIPEYKKKIGWIL